MLFHNLPKDLVQYILSWEGSMKFRNGKWMNQIRTSEETRELLQQLIAKRYKSYKRRTSHWNVILIQINIPTSPDIGKVMDFYIFNNPSIAYMFSKRGSGYGDRIVLEQYDYWEGKIKNEGEEDNGEEDNGEEDNGEEDNGE